ncbi:MAG: DsrE family protein [Gemmatimonadota bacterium]|nr:DsrE family protein [Gemmatimonadota bacterium]MDH5805842.1 DsrE family protein [Gemmatimonadota bacterium]
MKNGIVWVIVALALVASGREALYAQAPEAQLGPVIQNYGPVFDVLGIDVAAPTDHEYKVVFDVSQGGTEPEALNRYIVTVARFLNMHARAGVPVENMHLAIVLHGSAAKAALSHEAYRERYEIDNPNFELVAALREAGVRIYLCGQSAMSRGFMKEDLAPSVDLALSAMTMMVLLQDEGYRLHGI